MVIDRFTGEHLFLSNFYPSRAHYLEYVFPSVENAYQAAKCKNDEDRLQFLDLRPGKSKRLGAKVSMRADWERVKVPIMRFLVQQKFEEDPDLRRMLRATGSAELIEGNNWGDTYWGQVDGVGSNILGKLLMEVRGNLK